ncbi:uncharacterized protein KY384_009147 [Bacidia gigantensis]|uniref:uncharacterized protein n=1 Tax=Bacidia gigantensis TaxID=2732470 RepID=UPI001D04B2E6|nr:uncharacterized protein KY384_009147 [Bacidia gigantensis]KAG8525503.1 hypothetical protein KY384_009147 [Bacidia gigantensis]
MYRVTARNAPRVCRASCGAPSRNLFTATPFFPHLGGSPFGAVGNDVFRLLESATADLVPQASRSRYVARSFTPRFDVREAEANYELQGELPGYEQKDLDIEFVDERTLVIKGKVANEEAHSNVSAVEDSKQKAVTAEDATSDNASEKSANYHKPSVEEEYIDAGAEAEAATEKAPTSSDVAQPTETKRADTEPAFKYWVSERSSGHFERRFSFPGRVNQNEVKASLSNGILSIVVPKIVEKEARRITIQ